MNKKVKSILIWLFVGVLVLFLIVFITEEKKEDQSAEMSLNVEGVLFENTQTTLIPNDSEDDPEELASYHNEHGFSISYPSEWMLFSDYPYDSKDETEYSNVVLQTIGNPIQRKISFRVTGLACNDYVEVSNGEITITKDTDFSEEFFIYCLPLRDYVETLWKHNTNSSINPEGKVVSEVDEVVIGEFRGYKFDTDVSFLTGSDAGEGLTLSTTNSFYFFQLGEDKFTVQLETVDTKARKIFETLVFE